MNNNSSSISALGCNIYSLQRYLAVSAEKADLRLEFKKGIKTPYTDKGTVYIPSISNKISGKDITSLFRFVNHEASHHLYGTDFKMVHDEAISTDKSLLGFTWGVLEDCRVDRLDSSEWLGDSLYMSDYYEQEHPEILDTLRSMSRESKSPGVDIKQIAALQSLIALDYKSRDWSIGAYNNLQSVEDTLIPEAKKYYDRMVSEGIHNKVNLLANGNSGSRAAWDLAQYIYENIFELDPEQEKQRCKQQQKEQEGQDGQAEKGKGKGGASQGQSGKQGEKDKRGGEGTEGSGGNEEGKGVKSEYGHPDGDGTWDISNATVKWKKLDNSGVDTSKSPYGKSGITIDYSNYTEHGTFIPAPYKNLSVIDYERGTYTNVSRSNKPSEVQTIKQGVSSNHHGNGLATKVRMLLQIRSKSRTQYGLKRGKLNNSSLYRVTMKDAPGYNERVFKDKLVNNTLDTAVSLVVDYSGSMGGSKSINAIKSAMLLYDAISKSLRVPLEIIGFTEVHSASLLMHFKSFDGRCSDEKLLDRMADGAQYMSQNADGEAIAYCYDRLKQRKEKKKVMIVLSDGQPSAWRSGDIVRYTKEVIKNIESQPNTDIIGIGIETKSVKDYYTTHQVISNSSELESALLNIIQSKLLQ